MTVLSGEKLVIWLQCHTNTYVHSGSSENKNYNHGTTAKQSFLKECLLWY
jgi:hypothetical protein